MTAHAHGNGANVKIPKERESEGGERDGKFSLTLSYPVLSQGGNLNCHILSTITYTRIARSQVPSELKPAGVSKYAARP